MSRANYVYSFKDFVWEVFEGILMPWVTVVGFAVLLTFLGLFLKHVVELCMEVL